MPLPELNGIRPSIRVIRVNIVNIFHTLPNCRVFPGPLVGLPGNADDQSESDTKKFSRKGFKEGAAGPMPPHKFSAVFRRSLHPIKPTTEAA